MNALFQIEIPRRNIRCHKGGEKFEPGMEYLSLMVEDPKEGYVRHDYCSNCWDAVEEESKIQWKSSVPVRKKESLNMKEQNDRAMELLREAMEEATPEAAEDAFVLGMYLKRKRILILRQEVEEEGQVADLYEDSVTEDMLLVKRVSLPAFDVEKVQARIVAKVHGVEEEKEKTEEPCTEEPCEEDESET